MNRYLRAILKAIIVVLGVCSNVIVLSYLAMRHPEAIAIAAFVVLVLSIIALLASCFLEPKK